MLTTAVLIAASLYTPADEPKKNPFTGGKSADTKPADKKPAEENDSKIARVAHIKLSGDLDESPVPGEALFGAPPENLRSKLERIRKAAKDDRIQALYLELHDISAGFGKLNELKRAVTEFKATGKKTFVYSEELSTKAFLIALGCDQIYVPEAGGVTLYGMRAEVTFYKDTLDLLKLKADVLRMGTFKAAVEPFISDKMSKENREQITALLNDNFDHEIVAHIIAGRPAQKFTADQVKGIIDQGPFTAKKALALGLVDKLVYEDQLDATFAKQLGVDEVKVQKNYGKAKAQDLDMSNPFALLSALGSQKKSKESKDPKIAVIYAVGAISSGKGGASPLSGGESVGSEPTVAAIREAEKNPTVKAIVLRVDSPGGSALASDMIWRALKTCKKPVIASMGDVAASGGYYIAMAGKKIYAEPGTVTGSIGVFGLKLVTGGLEEYAGMKTEVVSRGKNSGVNSTTFAWSESERAAMMSTIEEIYAQFIDKAVAGRHEAGVKITREQLLSYAGGRVWTGRQAKERGLVDELGTLEDAIAEAKKQAGIDPKKEMELLILPKAETFLDKLMDGDVKMPFGAAKAELRLIPGADKVIKMAAPLLETQKDPVKVLLPFHVEFK
ncbi:Protease IV [Fimbriiglobus ruber]|uniref:Protease IV n=2 Tax=Fimbriiglobus ruber TaxID=1908690 RepID=A0A225EBL7_9BACT|nr:Protease IV [Fimbriiglobus ruber]